jgi:hypothetical protein
MDVSLSKSTDLGLQFRTAAYKGDIQALESIYNQAPDMIHSQGQGTGRSALHQAARKNHIETVKWLLAHQANPMILDTEGNNPLQVAILYGAFETIHFLITSDLKLNLLHENNAHKTILMQCVSYVDNENNSLKIRKQMSLLIAPIKTAIRNQINKMPASEINFESVVYHPDGRVQFIKTKQEAFSAMERGELQVNKVFVAPQKDNRLTKEHLLYIQGKDIVQPMPQNVTDSFKLTPLVFFMNHTDNTTFEVIQNNFNFLKTLGYKGLLFEMDESKSIDQVINFIAPNLKINSDFLLKVKGQNWLTYHGIDADLPHAFRSTTLVASLTMSPPVNAFREQSMAQNIAKYAKLYNGGVIIIMGAAHYNVAQKLFSTLGAAFNHVHYMHAYQSGFDLTHEDGLSDLELELTLKATVSDFKSTTLKKENYPNASALYKSFRMAVRDGLLCVAPKEEYQKEVLETGALSTLRSILPQFANFRGMLKAATYQVDACLPVADIEEYKTQSGLLARETGIQALPCYVKSKQDNSKVSLHLKVEDINGPDSVNYQKLQEKNKRK